MNPADQHGNAPLRRLEILGQDLRYALRMLRRSPAFTVVALLSLGFGIGTNTAIFNIVDALLLESLPVADADRLVVLQRKGTSASEPNVLFSYRMFHQISEASNVCRGVFAFTRDFTAIVRQGGASPIPATVSNSETQETAMAQLVSGNFFSTLDVVPAVGRTFAPDEDVPPLGHPVAVISYGYWTRRFARNPAAVGSTVVVNGAPLTVIGVLPPQFFGVFVDISPDLYLPLTLREAVHYSGNTQTDGPDHPGPIWNQPHNHWLELMARRRPGVDLRQATAALDVLFHRELREAATDFDDPNDRRDSLSQRLIISAGARGLSQLRERLTAPLLILLALAGLVLLIACANVANLLLARADRRRKEMAVRLGVGAGRGRLIRQLLTESLLLASLGGVLGLLFGFWGSRFLYTLVARPEVPIQIGAAFDLRKLAVAAAIAMATGLIFGLAPALLATRVDLSSVLKDASRAVAGSGGRPGRRFPLGRILVAAQISLSLVLLIGAGLFVRSLRNVMDVDAGFKREGLLIVEINPRLLGVSDTRLLALYRRLQEQVASLPGVRSVSISLTGLFRGHIRSSDLAIPGVDPHKVAHPESLMTDQTLVTSDYFATVGIPILQGRGLTDRDREGAAEVAVISESMARRFFPRGNAIGHRFGFGGPKHEHDYEIVGVAKDSKYNSLRETSPLMVYRTVFQDPDVLRYIMVRSDGAQEASVAARLRRTIAEVEPELSVTDVTTMEKQLDRSVGRERAIARLSGFFSGLALLLAAIGLYGVMSYAVARRTNELGVRMALGAPRSNVLRLILVETLQLIAIGLGGGLIAALGLSRLAASQLFELRANDPLTIVVATVAMAIVAILAGYLPARRASETDPMAALRYE